MELPKEAITEYKLIIKNHGFDLSDEEIAKQAIIFFKLFKEIYKPIPEKKPEKDP